MSPASPLQIGFADNFKACCATEIIKDIHLRVERISAWDMAVVVVVKMEFRLRLRFLVLFPTLCTFLCRLARLFLRFLCRLLQRSSEFSSSGLIRAADSRTGVGKRHGVASKVPGAAWSFGAPGPRFVARVAAKGTAPRSKSLGSL